ncbi:MAG: outer-membrane lipoprotein carrier protein LolA [Spirochaetes bacterium]|nr:outer-membrane lipoprotein carrier protein LolA [Spirochaetota bacterium]
MKRYIATGIAVLALCGGLQAQGMQTADQFFEFVSGRYGQVTDYEAQLTIDSGKTTMKGSVSYKSPSYLRIDFTQPADQVICFNGEVLVVYLPEFRTILSQEVAPGSASGPAGAGMASGEGLKLLKKSYTVAYETSPSPVPLEPGSSENVIRLSLNRRTVAEGFRNIKLSVNPETKIIRRIEGLTISGETISFTFSDVKTNQNIPIARFSYDLPAGASTYNDFLFKTEE